MTRKTAIENAIAILSANNQNVETVETLSKILEGLNRERKPMSDEKKAEINKKRQQENKIKREALVAPVIPVLRMGLADGDMTAKALYEKVKDSLPTDFTIGKVQAILLKEMSSEVQKIENGRNAFTYRLI